MAESTRRHFLRNAWKAGSATLLAAFGYTAYEALRPLTTGAAGTKIVVGDATRFSVGTSTYVPAGRLYVVNAKNHLFALSQKCPHLGCKVPYCASSGRFECACHGSVYDIAGEYISGPTPRGMDRYQLTLDGANVVVDTSVLHLGPDRGVRDFYADPLGPSCIGKA